MGAIESEESGARMELLARTLVGRSPHCDLVLGEPSVSGDHAALAWGGDAWTLRDLGSRNGTVVDGAPAPPGRRHRLAAGARIVFGRAPAWRLVEAGPPFAHALELGGGAVVAAEGGMIGLPDPEAPEVVIVQLAGGGWVVERGDEAAPAAHRGEVVAGGRTWRLHLPAVAASTVGRAPAVRALDGAAHALEVDGRGRIQWWCTVGGERLDLGRRSFNALLMALALARREDAAEGHSPSACGWRYREVVAAAAGIEVGTIKVFAYRARRALAKAGVEGAAGLIEHRRDAGQMRLGVHAAVSRAP